MKIPNPKKAVVEIRKLRDYCLNTEHRIGKHKARLFMAALGLTFEDAEALRAVLREIVKRMRLNSVITTNMDSAIRLNSS